MIGLVDAAKIAGGFALGALLVAPAAHYLGKREARQETAAAAAVEAINRIQELEKNNATFRSLPSRDCQSARNVDPLSASNIHPPVGDQRLACPALAGVAEGRPSAGDGYLRL